LILDEAHELTEKALNSLARSFTMKEAGESVRGVDKLVGSLKKTKGTKGVDTYIDTVKGTVDVMREHLADAGILLDSMTTPEMRNDGTAKRFQNGKLPDDLAEVARNASQSADDARDALSALRKELEDEGGSEIEEVKLAKLIADLGSELTKIDRIAGVWSLLADEVDDAYPVAKWMQVVEGAAGRDIKVCASPVTVARDLNELLWRQCASVVLVSATLYTVGGFRPFLKESGLSLQGNVTTLNVESPFSYETQARIVVPKGMRSPKDSAGHTKDLASLLPSWLDSQPDGEGSLVLFSSWRQLREVAELMPVELRGRILMQGECSKRELLERHRAAIEAGKRSVLFGTSSLEQGVDLPGKLLTMVVIAKLQFNVPSDPVEEARNEWMEQHGMSYFEEVALPRACRRLYQSGGRLIRNETDHGTIIVADTRLAEKSFGRSMLAALPPYARSRVV
jgi:ATP-dependent DNA helicase DinG